MLYEGLGNTGSSVVWRNYEIKYLMRLHDHCTDNFVVEFDDPNRTTLTIPLYPFAIFVIYELVGWRNIFPTNPQKSVDR